MCSAKFGYETLTECTFHHLVNILWKLKLRRETGRGFRVYFSSSPGAVPCGFDDAPRMLVSRTCARLGTIRPAHVDIRVAQEAQRVKRCKECLRKPTHITTSPAKRTMSHMNTGMVRNKCEY